MSYEGNIRVPAGYGYLGAILTIGSRQASVRTLQGELIRLNFQPGSTGADGRWGPRTATALRNAARYVGYAGEPFTPPNAEVDTPPPANVDVPDDLLRMLRSAQPAPAGTPGAEGANGPVDPASDSDTPSPAPGGRDRMGWVPAAAIGGAVILIGGLIAWQARPKKTAVAANRRRRRR